MFLVQNWVANLAILLLCAKNERVILRFLPQSRKIANFTSFFDGLQDYGLQVNERHRLTNYVRTPVNLLTVNS
jgi:hypothetical protein